MIDLTKFGVTKGPWTNGMAEEYGEDEATGAFGIYSADRNLIVADYYCEPLLSIDATILTAAYETLASMIEWVIADEATIGSGDDRMIRVIEKTLGLPWPEIRKRLEE